MEMSTMIRGLLGESIRNTDHSYDISKAKGDIEQLEKRMSAYGSVLDYSDGDIIEWKPGLKDCGNKFPAYGQPVYCVHVSASREPCEKAGPGTSVDYKDLTFCIFHEDADSVSFFTGDSQRFRKYRKPSE